MAVCEDDDGQALPAGSGRRGADCGRGVRPLRADRPLRRLPARAPLLGRRHLDQAQERLLADPAGLVPGAPDVASLFDRPERDPRLGRDCENSLIVAAFVTTVLAVVIGACAGYSMARFQTGGKHLAFWFLSQRFMPPIAVVIPIFLLYRNAQGWFGITLFDTRFGLVLLYTVFVAAVHDLDDVRLFPADADRARRGGARRRLLALAGAHGRSPGRSRRPGIVSAGAFAFIFSLTEFLFALVLTSQHAVTLPVVIAGMTTASRATTTVRPVRSRWCRSSRRSSSACSCSVTSCAA